MGVIFPSEERIPMSIFATHPATSYSTPVFAKSAPRFGSSTGKKSSVVLSSLKDTGKDVTGKKWGGVILAQGMITAIFDELGNYGISNFPEQFWDNIKSTLGFKSAYGQIPDLTPNTQDACANPTDISCAFQIGAENAESGRETPRETEHKPGDETSSVQQQASSGSDLDRSGEHNTGHDINWNPLDDLGTTDGGNIISTGSDMLDPGLGGGDPMAIFGLATVKILIMTFGLDFTLLFLKNYLRRTG